MILDKKIIIAPIFLALSACSSAPFKGETLENIIQKQGMIQGYDCENTGPRVIDIKRQMPCNLLI